MRAALTGTSAAVTQTQTDRQKNQLLTERQTDSEVWRQTDRRTGRDRWIDRVMNV